MIIYFLSLSTYEFHAQNNFCYGSDMDPTCIFSSDYRYTKTPISKTHSFHSRFDIRLEKQSFFEDLNDFTKMLSVLCKKKEKKGEERNVFPQKDCM